MATTITTTTAVITNPAAGGVMGDKRDAGDNNCSDSIGLTISVSADHDDEEKTNPASVDDASFLPSSVGPSPIPFEEEEEDHNDGSGYGIGANQNHTNDATKRDNNGSPGFSSIMRQHPPPSSFSITPVLQGGSAAGTQNIPGDQSHIVAALEDRVRDLEEKLSTLSMMIALQPQSPKQQQQQHHHHHQQQQQEHQHSPRTDGIGVGFVRRSPPLSSPEIPDDSSSVTASPPSNFRSLASFSTIPSSNVPVLESPTPVSRRYHRSRGSFSKPGSYANPFEPTRSLAVRERERRSPMLNRNLSYRILHAPNSVLDLRSVEDEDDGSHSIGHNRSQSHSISDTGSDTDQNQTTTSAGTDSSNYLRSGTSAEDSFEKACRVPTLDSLPGSSRTSPILSKDPAVNMVLSPDSVKDTKNLGDEKNSFPSPALVSGSHDGTRASPSTTRKRSASISTKTVSHSVTSEGSKSKPKSNIKSKWMGYLNSVQDTNYDTDKQMEEFVRVPSAVEALLSFGFWISVDSFLYTLTMLPLRFVYSTCLLIIWVYKRLVGSDNSGIFTFHRHNSYHLIQASIIYIICAYVLVPIDVSVLYHWIRSQSMVKLYLLVAIVEVFDRLMCSLGQDCLDSLYWNTTRRPRSSRLLVSAMVVLVYTGLHSILLFVHVATLNVAINSNDQTLLSLLIGGNFAEIKSTVFKKYNKATLFKITSSDICERFKLALFLLLVLTLNASQGMDATMLYNYLSMCWIVWCAEWLSDWLKHAFITKFNYIASGVYAEYGLLLAGDVSGFGHEGENLDVSHAVVKRLGLAQIPLVCVMTKYLKEAYKYQTYENQPRTWVLVAGFVSVWLVLLATKTVLGIVLQRICRNKLEAAPEFSKTNTAVGKKKTN